MRGVGALDGRVAVVTGGGAGIGGGISRLFAAEGARVFVAEIDPERATAIAEAVRGDGGALEVHVCDVRESDAVTGLAEAALRWADGGVDVLVNNVGDYRPAGAFDRTSEEDWQALYDVNLLHVFRCTRAFLPGMLEGGAGAIVNVSTVEAFRGIPLNAVYSAFKAGVVGFTRSLAIEVGGRGVRVNAIAPDVTDTPQTPYHRWVSAEEQELVPSWVPVGRFGKPEDLARVALFLASDASAFVTGQTLPVDGGTLAAGGWYKLPGEQRWTNRPRNP